MRTSITIVLLIASMAFLGACNKTKTNSNRLIKGGEWTVTELSVNGTNEAELPEWEIEDCEIYDASCEGEWKNEEGGHAEFIWQFRAKGDNFEISHQAEAEEDGHAHGDDHAAEEAAAQCYAFSGVYDVVTRKKKEMEFTSTTTVGHPGATVVIKIEKK